MKQYGIIGYPLTHSFSKQYFTEKIREEGISGASFQEYPLSSISALPALLANNSNLQGLAVTIPYKESVLQFIHDLSPEVREIGAANCLRIKNGHLKAYNTDILGFEKSFVKHLQPHHKKALVAGSGGASKAVQYVMKKLGIPFLVISRSDSHNQGFVHYDGLTKELINDYTVVINCTPLGMPPLQEDCPPIPYEFLTNRHYLYDLVYKPEKTIFLQKGEERGAIIKNGFEMLIIQAEANWRIWNDIESNAQ